MNLNKSKIDKLDNLLLFLSSSIGIFFSLISLIFATSKLTFLVILFPVVFFGWFLPVYVGYWRGAIKFDGDKAILERGRGWIYFFTGFAAFSIIAVTIAVFNWDFVLETYVDLFRPFSGIDVIFSVLVIPIAIGVVVAYASKSFVSKTESVIRKELIEPILGEEGREKAQKIFNWTSIASYLFVAGFTSSTVGFMIEGKKWNSFTESFA